MFFGHLYLFHEFPLQFFAHSGWSRGKWSDFRDFSKGKPGERALLGKGPGSFWPDPVCPHPGGSHSLRWGELEEDEMGKEQELRVTHVFFPF